MELFLPFASMLKNRPGLMTDDCSKPTWAIIMDTGRLLSRFVRGHYASAIWMDARVSGPFYRTPKNPIPRTISRQQYRLI